MCLRRNWRQQVNYSLISIILISSFFSCSSINRYTLNRGHDLADILTVGLEKNNVGVNAFFWCLGGGISSNQSSVGVGIREGHFGYYLAGGKNEIRILQEKGSKSSWNQMGNSQILINSSQHNPYHPSPRQKNKSYETLNILFIFPIPRIKEDDKSLGRCDSPIKFEASLGIYYGMRVGINFTELLDFTLGITTIDFKKDDLLDIESETKIERNESGLHF